MSRLDLRHVRSILAVAEHLHFGHAAEALGMAPPALTRQIQEAERLLGVRLFHRTRRSVELSAAGAAFLDDATSALDHLDRAAERAQFAQRGELGHVALGYVASAAYTGVLQRAVCAFRETHPGVRVSLREVPMDTAGAMLDARELDAAYVRPPVDYPEGVQTRTVHRDAFIVALPEASPLVAHTAIAPLQLRGQTFVVPEQESGTLEVARRGHFSPVLGERPGSLAAVLALVAAVGHVAVIPQTLASCLHLPGIVFRPITGKPIPSEIALAFRRHEHAPAIKAFIKAAKAK